MQTTLRDPLLGSYSFYINTTSVLKNIFNGEKSICMTITETYLLSDIEFHTLWILSFCLIRMFIRLFHASAHASEVSCFCLITLVIVDWWHNFFFFYYFCQNTFLHKTTARFFVGCQSKIWKACFTSIIKPRQSTVR